MKVIARLNKIEQVDVDLDMKIPLELQKLSFKIDIHPNHEIFSFHIPMKREEGIVFEIGKYYDINVTEVSEKTKKELLEL
jgi:hypothetical protein